MGRNADALTKRIEALLPELRVTRLILDWEPGYEPTLTVEAMPKARQVEDVLGAIKTFRLVLDE